MSQSNSILIIGRQGCGKTTLMTQLAQAPENKNASFVDEADLKSIEYAQSKVQSGEQYLVSSQLKKEDLPLGIENDFQIIQMSALRYK